MRGWEDGRLGGWEVVKLSMCCVLVNVLHADCAHELV